MNFFAKAGARVVENALAYDGWNRLHRMILDYTGSRGQKVHIVREVVDHGSAAAILLYNRSTDSVVLVRQFRPAAFFNGSPSFMLEIPAGLLDDDRPEEAARREALEETGYAVRNIMPVFTIYPSPGSLTEQVHLFVGAIDEQDRVHVGGGLDEEDEDIEIVELQLDDAHSMIASGSIPDAKTIVMLQWAIANRDKLAAL
jgi:nudix-type nucleoside diphosphatase (YffH/AdpP family)